MNPHAFANQPLVFTLDEEPAAPAAAAPSPAVVAAPADDGADWERSLEQLRQAKQQRGEGPASAPVLDVFAATRPAGRDQRALQTQLAAAVEARVRQQAAQPPRTSPMPEPAATVLDPVARERVYQAYLQQWQRQHALAQAQQQTALNDTALLLQEDWLAAQECLQTAPAEGMAACVVQLNGRGDAEVMPPSEAGRVADGLPESRPEPELDGAGQAAATEGGVTRVHLHVLPPKAGRHMAVACVSERELLARLGEKLRPHLADAMAGMVRVAVQKHTAQLVSQLQQQLLAEVPAAVDDILQHHLQRIMPEIKKDLRRQQWAAADDSATSGESATS